ncbi:N-acetyltransferase [Rhodoferax sp.]|uniref:GNAT family N-acetyltransferase n=1 Tax=Rhodoferax sp. TaxID=50421 RepID=UPI0034566071
MTIRSECPADRHMVEAVTRQAFLNHPHSGHTEHLIVDGLRLAGALTISLVAERAGQVVGHIAFSPVTVSDGSTGWYGLGPVSVAPACQGQGIGRTLVEHGLACLRDGGAQGCVLLGEPSFYGRFGFVHQPGLYLAGVPQDFFLALPFGTTLAQGQVVYHAAFGIDAETVS